MSDPGAKPCGWYESTYCVDWKALALTPAEKETDR